MNMTPENCEAVCLTSRLVIIYALGNYANSNPQEVPEWFGLLRGMYQVFNLATQMKDGVSEMFKPYLESSMVMIALEDLPVLQGEDFPGLAPFGEDTPLLDGSHDSDATDAEAISAYQTVIRILQLNINQTKTLCEAGTEPQAVFCWPIHVPQTFVDYLTERRPRALVIMAYFCTLWKRMEHLWWAKGNAEYELAKVKRMLSPEWHPYLEWPSSQIFDDPNMPVALQSPMPEIFETMSSTASDAAEESSSEPYWTYLGSSVGKQR